MKCKKVDCHYRSKFEGKIEFCDVWLVILA